MPTGWVPALLSLCVPVVVDALHTDISSQEILVILSASLWQVFQTAMTDYCWLLSVCTIMMCTHPSPTVSASTESIHKDMDIKEFYELSLPIQMYLNYVSICIIIAIYLYPLRYSIIPFIQSQLICFIQKMLENSEKRPSQYS